MRHTLKILALGICANALVAAPVSAQPAVEVTLTRLSDCGTPQAPTEVNQRFSDTYSYGGLKIQFVFSCYLIKHGDSYMMWDTGHSMTAPSVAPKVSVVDQLAQLGVKPEQIQYVGISHYHADHTGQVASFPQSTLLIGKGDWDAITAPKPAAGVNAPPFAHWISGGGKVEPQLTDKDVFGDGTVVILNTPGHTPGHHSLLVKLKEKGNVLISGDLVHFHENYEGNGVPWFNTSRADTLASIDRFKKLAANFKAQVIIQHDARDIGKLPAFPAAAK
jgi:glyoxylase-like metal-dependent hydrolase (beta-lactamase superfamily II)